MAMQETSPASSPSAQVIGNAFVEQYYLILHKSPELLHRFYQESSQLSRTDSSGVMSTVTTTEAIKDKILSLNYNDYMIEIETADAQDSHQGGVLVLVTGCLTGRDDVRRKFMQTFFLAPQDKGYFVLNDVSRFVEDNAPQQRNPSPVEDATESTPPMTLAADKETTRTSNEPVLEPETSPKVENLNGGAQMHVPSDDEKVSGIEDEAVIESPTKSNQAEVTIPVVDSSTASLEGTSKKSYASIVKVKKGNRASTAVYVPAGTVRAAPTSTEQQPLDSIKSASVPEAAAPMSDTASESNNVQVEVIGHSIYIKNLPFYATPEELYEVFKQFGPIKNGGIQVRSSKGFCFGFVEFELLSSMQCALEASPITIGGQEAVIEKKRTTNRVGSNGRGSYLPGRGGFRGRGSFVGGRGYGRNEFRGTIDFRIPGEYRSQGGFSGGRRGAAARGGRESYQRVNQSDSERAGRGFG